jgi:hypothetical protein
MRVDILTTASRAAMLQDSLNFWHSHGWTTQVWDNTDQPPGAGRNRILADFYASKRPWLAMVDDDQLIDIKRGWGARFMANPWEILHNITPDISSWGLLNNRIHRVDVTVTNPVVAQRWCFVKTSWIGCVVFHRNTGQQYWQHPTGILEEMDFCLAQFRDGYKVATCSNLVQHDRGGRSTLFTTQQQRVQAYKDAQHRVIRDWPGCEIRSGKLYREPFIKRYWRNTPGWGSVKNIGLCWQYPEPTTSEFDALFSLE